MDSRMKLTAPGPLIACLLILVAFVGPLHDRVTASIGALVVLAVISESRGYR